MLVYSPFRFGFSLSIDAEGPAEGARREDGLGVWLRVDAGVPTWRFLGGLGDADDGEALTLPRFSTMKDGAGSDNLSNKIPSS